MVNTLEGHREGESVEALQFVDVLGGAGGGRGLVLVSGGTDGKGFVWDIATGRVRAELMHDVSTLLAAISLNWDNEEGKLTPPNRNPSRHWPLTLHRTSTSSPRRRRTGY